MLFKLQSKMANNSTSLIILSAIGNLIKIIFKVKK